MSQSKLTLQQLLLVRLINWPNRVREQSTAIRAETANRITEDFMREIQQEFPKLSNTDLGMGLQSTLSEYPSLVDWYDGLLKSSSTIINWQRSEPWIAHDQISYWSRLLNELDEDSLICFDFARRFPKSDVHESSRGISKWRTVCRAANYDLEVLWGRGLSDLHVHVGGTRIPQHAWLFLMGRPKQFRRFKNISKAFSEEYLRKNALNFNRQELPFEAVIKNASQIRSKIVQHLEQKGLESYWFEPTGSSRNWSSRELLPERLLMICAWQDYLRTRSESLLVAIDQYVNARHFFFSFCRQPVFRDKTGLRNFSKEHFPKLKQHESLSGRFSEHWTINSSRRYLVQPSADAVSLLSESRNLKKVELRIAPFDRARDYWRFFKTWDLIYPQLAEFIKNSGSTSPDVRFAIHFIRSRHPETSWGLPSQSKLHTKTIFSRLDRQSSALKIAMSCPERSHYLSKLARIDIAGEERDTTSTLFGLHFRLLRGDFDALQILENFESYKDVLPEPKYWRRLAEQNRHLHEGHEKRLGITVHAGEDYADVLEGLYQVDSAIRSCNLQSGDSIGHGLALTASLNLSESNPAFIETGAAFDSCCWLYNMFFGADSEINLQGQSNRERQLLRETIKTLGSSLYSDFIGESELSLRHLVESWRFRYFPTLQNSKRYQLASQTRRILELETLKETAHCDEVIRRRERPIPATGRRSFESLVDRAQQLLLKKVINRRIVIELNPSSNLRMSGSLTTQETPTVDLLKATANGLLACVNTDDPGVFASCIENEYAKLLDGCSDLVGQSDVYALLENVRRIGLERVY